MHPFSSNLTPLCRYWRDPGAFQQFHDIEGPLGRFLGFWSGEEAYFLP